MCITENNLTWAKTIIMTTWIMSGFDMIPNGFQVEMVWIGSIFCFSLSDKILIPNN